ncbi:MAG: DUF6033 family protein [Lachnospiraceae bacterium]|nr:DUF6033 family protein [Lachnospiraceae bacterium]
MASINGISAYQQTNQSWKSEAVREQAAKVQAAAKAGETKTAQESGPGAVKTKGWSPISETSSLIPAKTEYGNAIGEVKLSDAAKDYYESLKSKFHNMDFIVVSKDMMDAVRKNASAYGNSDKPVVLIDEEKLERMATDEEYRNKYEGIIAMSEQKLLEAKSHFASTGANVKNFGVVVDDNGNEKYFAVLEKSSQLQRERIEKHAEEKKEQRIKENRDAKEEARNKQIQNVRDRSEAERAQAVEEVMEHDDMEAQAPEKEYVSIEASSMEELFSKVQTYSYQMAASAVRTDAERMVGANIDFKG